jgi:hypothetical protein
MSGFLKGFEVLVVVAGALFLLYGYGVLTGQIGPPPFGDIGGYVGVMNGLGFLLVALIVETLRRRELRQEGQAQD